MKNIVYLFVLSLLVLTACEDEKLLDPNPHNLTDQAHYTTVAGATQGLFAAYDILQAGERVERIELLGTVCSGDALPGGEPGGNDQPPMQQAAKFLTSADNNYMFDVWRSYYTGVYRCNLLIGYLEDVDLLFEFPEDVRTRLLGDALFLRGLFHFKLQIFFGGYPQLQGDFGGELKGVPFIDHPLSPAEWNQERPSLEETWTKIEDDFKAAAAYLPKPSAIVDAELGRATKGAAIAMLAKTHLYQDEFQDAYNAAKEVIDWGNSEYVLMGEDANPGPFTVSRWTPEGMTPIAMPGYQYIWQYEANNCKESIFDVQHYGDNVAGSTDGSTEGNILAQYYGVRQVYAHSFLGFTSIQYYWGFILPTPYFIETAYEDIGCEVAGEIVDPRYRIAVIEPTDSVPYQYPVDLRDIHSDSVLFNPWGNWPSTGYSTWKYFIAPEADQRASWYENPQNTKYFRFADLLLIGAEAAVEIGETANALTWINRVRERARNSGNTNYPEALSAVTVEDVYAERRVELAFESHQFFDIVRTGRANKILKEDAMEYPTVTNPETGDIATVSFGDAFQIGKHEIFPIPETEIDLSNKKITQNPNY